MRFPVLCAAALALTACFEPQIATDIPTRPSTEFQVTTLADSLNKPWAVAELTNGEFLVTEIGGALYRVSGDGRNSYAGLPDDIFVGGQGGLLDVVLAPDFANSSVIFISYAYGTQDANGTALIRAKLATNGLASGNRLDNVTEIFRTDPPKAAPQHFGGRIAFLLDDTVVLSLGDGFAYREEAQKLTSHLGTLVRLNQDGTVPEDNPFIGQDGAKPEIYSYGHRNVQGLAYDAETRTMWEHEHGPRGGDEINAIRAGDNYGWPIATYGTDYQGARISPFETYDGMIGPRHVWVPSIAPSGLAIYRGDMFPEWNGHALVGGLASRDLRVVDLREAADKSVTEIDLLSDLNGRVRDVRVAYDGAILVLIESADADGDGKLDEASGKLLRITPK